MQEQEQEQAMTAGPTSLPKSEEELKAMVYRWLLSHGQAVGIVLGVVLVGMLALNQTENIEASFRM